jgi:hypothetical protein
VTFRLTTRPGHPTFTDLPWEEPLERWASERLVTPVRGISRHVVRFAAYGPDLYALKEIPDRVAGREYRLLRELAEQNVPVVEAVGMATGRTDSGGDELDGVLITRHLSFSLPYRSLFAHERHKDLWGPLLDALAELLVRIHLVGFFWGDCSLSNTLFRRDAGALAAHLVDAETGEMHPKLSDGQREHDLTIAVENLAGELLDLQAAGELNPELDPVDIVEELPDRYGNLWHELTRDDVAPTPDRHWVNDRIRRLNELGFDVREVELAEAADGWHLSLQTAVMEQGYNARRLLALTGLDAQENQARRLLNDVELFRDRTQRSEGATIGEQVAALRWLVEVFQPTLERVPEELREKLEPAELFHQILEHRWFMGVAAGRDVGREAAVEGYVRDVLAHRPDERSVLERATGPVPITRITRDPAP